MGVALVVNSGSSSFKYRLIDPTIGESGRVLAVGLVERIGDARGRAKHEVWVRADGPTVAAARMTHEREGAIPDHTAGFRMMLEAFAAHGPSLAENPPVAVGHRVVHGGDRFVDATLVDDAVERAIDELAVLAPLHNPGALQGIRAARAAFDDVPHVAVFDTAFHQTLAPAAYTYAIDADAQREEGIRRYGFHGTSHKYVSERAARLLGRPLGDIRQLVFHLGNGASATAVAGGRSVETSMGFTPLEGLVMGTRTGDIDPAVVLHLARRGRSIDEIDDLLNKRSGMLGLAGAQDMRDVIAGVEAGDERAELALDVYVHRLVAYAGAYIAQMGGIDAISFTAGVGENTPLVRERVVAALGFLGIRMDDGANRAGAAGVISAPESTAAVLIVPTDEELEIATQTLAVLDA
ncbi:acetate/propionate family kinase [Microbacterium halophytorum]|uniref:acetate/propionate family kinase n=1 Tax=Microbacterium halophytorum TaxID=2067568 RepID=UPI000CFC452C|nr:acetate kinase [Microbacterium halophytorum]